MPQLVRTTEGKYAFASDGCPKGERHWTAYVAFMYGDEDIAEMPVDEIRNLLASGHGSCEEIDIVAPGENTAYAVAAAALDRDYESGGRIVVVEERHAGIIYL